MTYHAYQQISKMVNNLIFLIRICHAIKLVSEFCNRLVYIVLESFSNETMKIFVAISLKDILTVHKLCIMPRLHLGPENKSLQNEAGRSIFTFKYVFVLVIKSTQQKLKTQ